MPVAQHIFYSWQADTPTATGKNLIGRALQDAIDTLNADAEIEGADRDDDPQAAILDHDTAGEPGSPPIVETIFRKIDRAAVFISDLTYVAERKDGRRSPNPNVLFEHGWAWKSLIWRAVISVTMLAILDADELYEAEYTRFVEGMAFAGDAEIPNFRAATEAVRRLSAAIA